MAEEDLIFGKNRHYFGGIEPSTMLKFEATSAYTGSEDRVRIQCTLPFDTVVDGQVLCTVGGAVIRKKTDGFPENEFDGTLVADITQDSMLYDTDVEVGDTVYYAAFPYSKQGVYNRSGLNTSKCTYASYEYLFGYDLDLTDNNPATRIAYPSGVDNAGYISAFMDYTTGVFSYGNWPSTPGEGFMPKPCMLTYAGIVDHYLNPNDYTKKVDQSASSVANTTFGGNAMMEWPKIYTKRWVEGNVYHFRCSDFQFDSDWDCWCNYDRENNVIPHFYTPIYFGSSISGKMRSISGQANYVNTAASSEITLAIANGTDWYTEVLADRLLIQDLLVLMGKSTDTQTVFGAGRCKSENTSAIGQGTMNTRGLFWGSTNQTDGVKVFGMENWWGNQLRRTSGWINASGTQKVKITRGTHDGSTATDYNTDGANYLTVGNATPIGTSGGYISVLQNLSWGRIPYGASGTSSTNEADGLWFDNAQSNYAFCGGDWSDALLGGAFAVHLDLAPSDATTYFGAALSCKPLAA